MSGLLIGMAVILGIALVAIGVVAVKSERWREKLVGVGMGIAGALAAIVAILTMGREKERASEVAASTKEIKEGRRGAEEDAKATEAAIEQEVAAEAALHEEASSEQEALKQMKRERLKS